MRKILLRKPLTVFNLNTGTYIYIRIDDYLVEATEDAIDRLIQRSDSQYEEGYIRGEAPRKQTKFGDL